MENNHSNLKKAIARFPQYEPDEEVWDAIAGEIRSAPLRAALQQLPTYEPDDQLWNLIERKAAKPRATKWWYAAAAVAFTIGASFLFFARNNDTIRYSQELADTRLQIEETAKTDEQYRLLAAYCETETLVCSTREYRNLKAEYEKLNAASEQLHNAIGSYNTTPALLRQYNEIEKQKTDILNEMAKMI